MTTLKNCPSSLNFSDPAFQHEFRKFYDRHTVPTLKTNTSIHRKFFDTIISWQMTQRKVCYYHNWWKHQIPGAGVRANSGNIDPVVCTGSQQKKDSVNTSKSDKILLVPSSRCANASSVRLGCSYWNMWITLFPMPQLLKNVCFRDDHMFYISFSINQRNFGICRKSYQAEIFKH